MGIRFQLDPQGPFTTSFSCQDVGRENRLQQEAIGMLESIWSWCFHKTKNPDDFIASLVDGIGLGELVDMIEFNGPDFERFDNPFSVSNPERGLASHHV